MNPSARSALTLAVLLVLPQLQALCPRLAPDVISGKVIPCRYLCIKINFLELPSIILSTERDGVLCSTLLLRRRGVCKNGGCIPFGSDDDIKPKGALGKVIAAIDKFASGSYRQKAPKPGTPFGPIVSTATSLFGGGSSTTSGGTSSAASSIVATATAAAVGSSLKKLFSESTSSSSENKRRNERPLSNPFRPSLSSIHKPVHPANAGGGTLPSGSSAVPVSFGGGPPVLPPSTEGGAEHKGTHASPGAPLPNSGGPSVHPVLTPFNNPPPAKQKDSLSPGSPSDVSNSAGGAISKAIGLVLGNIREMSGTTTHGIPSGQQTSGGPVVGSKHHLDSSVRDIPKPAGVTQNGHIREATGGSGATPMAFPVGGSPPIAQPSSWSRTESDGKERFGGFAASAIQEGHPLIPPGAPAVTSLGYKPKLPPTASAPSRLPSIGSQAPSAASRAENSAGPYGDALARLRENSQGSTRNTFPGQHVPAAFGETSVPSSRSSVITSHKSTSDHEVINYKETGAHLPSAGATAITAGFGHGSRAILPSTRGVAERHRAETSRLPVAPKEVPRPLNTAKPAAEPPDATLLGPSSLPTSDTIGMTSPSVGISPLKPPPTPPSESSSGSLINISLVKPLQKLRQVAAGKPPAISVRQPSSVVPGVSSAPANNSPIAILRKGVNEPEVKPTKRIAGGPLPDNPTQAAVESNGGALPNPPSTLAAAEKKRTEAFQTSTVPSMIQPPTVIVTKTVEPNITYPGGLSEMSTNKPSDKPSSSIGNSPAELSAALASPSATSSGVKTTLGGVLNPLKQLSGSTTTTMLVRKPPSPLTDNTSNPSTGSRILHKAATGSEVKPTEGTVLGALDGSRTNAAVKLSGGAPSVTPSTVAQTERGGAEASRLSAAPSKISRPALSAETRADVSIKNIRGPSQISTKHGNEPSPSVRSTGLEVTAASQSMTADRSRKKKTFRGILNAFRRARIATISHFRPTYQVATNATSKPSDSSSIQNSHKGASRPEVEQSKTTVSRVLPGNPTTRNVLLGSGAPPPSPPVINAADINQAATSPSSAAEHSALRPPKVAAETSEASTNNIELHSQVSTKIPVNGPVSSIKNAELQLPSASPSPSSSGSQIEKALGGDLTTLWRISKDSETPVPSKKPSLVAATEKLKPIINITKDVSGTQKHDLQAEKKGTLHGSAPMIPAAAGNRPPIFQSSTKKSPETGSVGVAKEPVAPLLRPISATPGMAEPSISRIEAHPPLTSSMATNTPTPSIKTTPVQPGASSRNLSSPERLQLNLPAPGTAPSPKKQSPEPYVGKPKQSKDSKAHSRSILARPDVNYERRESVLGGGEPARKTSDFLTLAPSKKAVSGEVKGTKNAIPPRLSIGSVVTAGLASLPESKKGNASKPSVSSFGSSNLPSVTIASDVLPHSKLNQRKHPSGSESTRNEGMKDSVASSSSGLGSTEPKTGTLLNNGAKGSIPSGLSAVVPHTAPNVLLTSQSRDRSSSSIGSKIHETKSHDVETKIINKSIASVLATLNGDVLFKPKENRTSTYDGKRLADNNVPRVKSSPHGGVEAKVIDGTNGLSKKEDQSHFSNNMAPVSNLDSLSSQIESGPSKVQIVQTNSRVQIAIAQSNKRGHHQEKKIPTIVQSGTETANLSPNSGKEYERVNKPNSNGASTTTSNSEGAPRNTVSPNSPVPAPHVSASSASATGTKNAASGISPISHANTVVSPSKTTATSGSAFSAHAGNQLASRITAEANQPPSVATATKRRNLSNGSKQGSETSGVMDARDNSESTRESRTSSQNTSSSSGRSESKMRPHTDVSSKASSLSTVKRMDTTSNLPLKKQSSSSTARPASIPTSVSAALRPASASSVPDFRGANRPADTLKSIGTSEKHTPPAGSLPNTKGSVSIGPAAEGIETPRPSPGTPTKTKGDAYNIRTSGPQAGSTASATSQLAAPNLAAPGATYRSTASAPSMAAASKVGSRNPSSETSENEVSKAKNVTKPGPSSDLAASAPISSAPRNLQASRSPVATTAKSSVQSTPASTPRLRSEEVISGENVSTTTKTPGGSAGSLEKAGTNPKDTTSSALSLPGEKIVASNPVKEKKVLKTAVKHSGIIKLRNLLSGRRNASRLREPSGSRPVPNPKTETATNKTESAVAEAKATTLAQSPTQPATSEKPPSHPPVAAPEDRHRTPIISTEQQAPSLYARLQSPGGIVFGGHPSVPGGFWGPAPTLPGIFRPF